MIKVALNARYLNRVHRTGIEMYVHNLTKSLREQSGLYVELRCPSDRTRNLRWDLWDFGSTDADVLHGPSYAIPVMSRCHAKRVVTVHDLGFISNPQFYGTRERVYLTTLWWWASKVADAIVVQSQTVFEQVSKSNPDAVRRTFLVPSGPSMEIDGPTDCSGGLLVIASITPRKNLGNLLRALRLKPVGVPVTLVGAPGLRHDEVLPQLREAHRSGLVRWMGYVEQGELQALFRHALAIVVPSWDEGLSFPVLDAVVHAKPVACSRIPAHMELLGDYPYYFDPGDPTDISATLGRLIADLRRGNTFSHDLGSRKNLYSWKYAGEAMAELYASVVGQS